MNFKIIGLILLEVVVLELSIFSMMPRTVSSPVAITREVVEQLKNFVEQKRWNLQTITDVQKQEMSDFLDRRFGILFRTMHDEIIAEFQRQYQPEVLRDVYFSQLNQKLNNGELLSYLEVRDFVNIAERKGYRHDRYKRLKYWITNKAGDYSMGQASFYSNPMALVERFKKRLNDGEGLSHAEVGQLLNALKDMYRDHSMYRGEEYRDHAGMHNGVMYGEQGNAHLDRVANQDINYHEDILLVNTLRQWFRSSGNQVKKYYLDGEAQEPVAEVVSEPQRFVKETINGKQVYNDDTCPVCMEELYGNEVGGQNNWVQLSCCNNIMCKDCFKILDSKKCPYCRADNPLNKMKK